MQTNSHVVFVNVASTGHMNPTRPVVAELTERGFEVTYFVEATMRDVVVAAGAAWHPLDNPRDNLDPAISEKYVPADTPEHEYEWPNNMLMHAEHKLPKLLHDLQALQRPPSVIVYDPFLAHALLAAHVLQVPAVSFLTMPGPGVLARPSAMVDAMEAQPWVQGPRMEIQKLYGFDLLEHGINMEFYSLCQNIATTIDDLFAPPWSERQIQRFGQLSFKCVGALFNKKIKRIANAYCSNTSEDLPWERIEKALSARIKLVYISMGTVGTSHRFWNKKFGYMAHHNGLADCTGKEFVQHVFRTCFEALGNEDSLLVIMSLGPQQDVLEGLPEPPQNFILRETVPQLDVLSRCHAFVTHGGANSMHESLALGVPLAVVPMFADQPINADSVAQVGAGFSFKNPLETFTVPSLRDAVDKLVDSSDANTFRAAARAMKTRMEDAGGATKAAEIILNTVREDPTAKAIGGA